MGKRSGTDGEGAEGHAPFGEGSVQRRASVQIL